MNTVVNALLIDRSPLNIQQLETALFQRQYKIDHLAHTTTLGEAIEKLTVGTFDVVLVGHLASDAECFELRSHLAEMSPHLPVFSISHLSQRLATESIALPLSQVDGLGECLRHNLSCTIEQRKLVTHLEETLQKLKASEDRYALAVEGAKDGIWDWDMVSNAVYYSTHWKHMLGFSDCELAPRADEWLERIHPDDFDRFHRTLNDYLVRKRSNFLCEYRLRHRCGHYIWVHSRGSARWDSAGQAYRIAGSQTDISHRKEIEKTLHEEKELAQVTLKSIGDAVITTDAQGRIKDFNPVAERLTGWSAESAKNRQVSQVCRILDGETRVPLESPSVLAIKEQATVSLSRYPTLIAIDGREVAIADSSAPIYDNNGDIVGSVLVFHDVTESREHAQKLAWQAFHDPLTHLANRAKFIESLDQLAPGNESFSHIVCYLDLDHFKIVNDTCGHAAGDELLRQVASILKSNIRHTDLLARLGGDEFGLLLHNCPLDQAFSIACELCDRIQKIRFLWEGKVFSIGVSIGLVVVPTERATACKLMGWADAACYAAKNKGRNQVQVYSTDNEEVRQLSADMHWFNRITSAMEQDLFCLYYQEIKPINESDEIIREILLRLIDEDTGEITPPMAFLPAAERYDLITRVDRWVIRHCFQALQNAKTPGILYNINLSGNTLNDDGFIDFLEEALDEFCVSPRRICFEITETVAISNLSHVATMIAHLKELGFRFALDDFGRGMSSFLYLKQLPVDYLKVDGSLVTEVTHDQIAWATLESINHICHIMGLSTVAEYVSSPDIVEAVKDLKFDYMQGFEIAPPCPLLLP